MLADQRAGLSSIQYIYIIDTLEAKRYRLIQLHKVIKLNIFLLTITYQMKMYKFVVSLKKLYISEFIFLLTAA